MRSDYHRLYGLLAEFETAEELVAAASKARASGYQCMDAYSPLPVHGLTEALGQRRTRLPVLVFLGGLVGAIGGYALQYFTTVVAYPLNVGGRPLHSWPSFVPVTFECTILLASLTAVIGMFALNRLPMPYHPVFNVPEFERASQDRFFLCIEEEDPLFDEELTAAFLRGLGAVSVKEVKP